MRKLTLGSLFSGSGGFELGGLLCGITPLWASEVEPFPIRVTTKRLPNVQHLGDINKINGATAPPVDIITGGFCCQDLSVAGKRAGLHGERSGLFFEVIRIIKEMRTATDGEYPKFAVLENVPGMYSSNNGLDFLEVLNELIHIKNEALSVPLPENGRWSTSGEVMGDGFSLGWRTLDAQFWGVAQRRRRCFIVADFTGECAGEILFNESRLSGHPSASGHSWQATAGGSAACTRSAGFDGYNFAVSGDVAATLGINCGVSTGRNGVMCLNDQGGACMAVSEDVTGTLRAQEHGHQPIVFEPGAASRVGGHVWEGFAGALRADAGDNQPAVAIPINTQIATRCVAMGESTGFGVGDDGDPAYTLQAAHSHAVVVENHPADSRVKIHEDGIVQTLDARMGMGGGNVPLVMNERQYALTVGEEVANTLTGTDYKGTQCVFEPKTLKIRSGCEGGGKGALVQGNLSATLSTANDQTVFVPNAASFMGGQGADARSIAYSEKATPTLRSQAGGNSVPMVMTAYGICSDGSNSMRSQNPLSGIYEAETSRTLDGNGGRPDCNQGGVAVVAVQGSMIGRADKNGPQGSGVGENVSFTLTEADRHAVCYRDTVSALTTELAHQTGSQGQNGGQLIVETEPVCYQDKIGSLCASDYKFPQQQQIDEGKAVVERVAVENYQHSGYREIDTAGTLKQCGGTNGGGSENVIIENRYVVRRLTPTECALLQGFPPDWCAGLETANPTEEDIAFWTDVWETQRRIVGTSTKPKSRNQIVKWLQSPHSDAAEYKMWGNGVALPCVCFVLGGIAWVSEKL